MEQKNWATMNAYLLPWNNEKSWMSPLTDAGVSEVRCPSAKTTKRLGVWLTLGAVVWDLWNRFNRNEHTRVRDSHEQSKHLRMKTNALGVEFYKKSKRHKCVCVCGTW